MLFQYHAGPASLYRLISVSENGQVWPNCSGRVRIGVLDDSGAVRSTISTLPVSMARTRSVSRLMGSTLGPPAPMVNGRSSADLGFSRFMEGCVRSHQLGESPKRCRIHAMSDLT